METQPNKIKIKIKVILSHTTLGTQNYRKRQNI